MKTYKRPKLFLFVGNKLKITSWWKYYFNSDARLITKQRRIATVESCFDLVGSRQHSVASNEVIGWSLTHPLNAEVMTLDEIQIQSFQIRHCHM